MPLIASKTVNNVRISVITYLGISTSRESSPYCVGWIAGLSLVVNNTDINTYTLSTDVCILRQALLSLGNNSNTSSIAASGLYDDTNMLGSSFYVPKDRTIVEIHH